jgi:hypothetical protein
MFQRKQNMFSLRRPVGSFCSGKLYTDFLERRVEFARLIKTCRRCLLIYFQKLNAVFVMRDLLPTTKDSFSR